MTITRQTLVKRLLHAYGEAKKKRLNFMERQIRDDLIYIIPA